VRTGLYDEMLAIAVAVSDSTPKCVWAETAAPDFSLTGNAWEAHVHPGVAKIWDTLLNSERLIAFISAHHAVNAALARECELSNRPRSTLETGIKK
jgi:hypothetical protein